MTTKGGSKNYKSKLARQEGGPFCCAFCFIAYPFKGGPDSHAFTAHKLLNDCLICGKIFSENDKPSEHFTKAHLTNFSPGMCNLCDEEVFLADSGAFLKHMRTKHARGQA